MPANKSESIKIYIVIGLSLVCAIVGYYRFLHRKAEHAGEPVASVATAAEHNVSDVEPKIQKALRKGKLPLDEPLRPIPRDIFAPLKSPKKAEIQAVAQSQQKPLPSFDLRGTIVSSGKPIAIINDQLVRAGEWIAGFKVVKISKTGVLLDSGKKRIVLEMLKNE